jgi:uncharacterized protein (TIGR02466 family)
MPGIREDWFPTAVWRFDLPDPEAFNARLLRLIRDERARDEPGVAGRSVVLGWHSSDTLHLRPEFRDFVDLVGRNQREVAEFLRWDLRQCACALLGCWANINGKFAHNMVHNHPRSALSGVYYVQVAEGCGNLFFRDPRPGAVVLAPTVLEYNRWTSDKVTYKPQAGRMLLFPSWLDHGVEPNLSDEERVCLSFNLGVQPLPPL